MREARATVGMAAMSVHAADLQDLAEQLVDAGRAVTLEQVAGLVRDAAALRGLVRIPGPEIPALSVPPEAQRQFDEVAAEFEREARVALDEAEHLLGLLRDADPASAAPIARDLGLAMHRLRGSALVAGFADLEWSRKRSTAR